MTQNNRLFVNALFCSLRTGASWEDFAVSRGRRKISYGTKPLKAWVVQKGVLTFFGRLARYARGAPNLAIW